MIYIFWTCRDQEEAKKIVRGLLDAKVIACASLFPEITSIYRWEGKIEEGREVKVILKTLSIHFKAIQAYILAHGSYQVPEIASIPASQVNPSYLTWLEKETA